MESSSNKYSIQEGIRMGYVDEISMEDLSKIYNKVKSHSNLLMDQNSKSRTAIKSL